MTSGVLGIIGCPMLEDNLIHRLRDDPEERTRLYIRDAEPGRASVQPTVDLYARCKSLLDGGPGSGS